MLVRFSLHTPPVRVCKIVRRLLSTHSCWKRVGKFKNALCVCICVCVCVCVRARAKKSDLFFEWMVFMTIGNTEIITSIWEEDFILNSHLFLELPACLTCRSFIPRSSAMVRIQDSQNNTSGFVLYRALYRYKLVRKSAKQSLRI